jgi:hypothetical protein
VLLSVLAISDPQQLAQRKPASFEAGFYGADMQSIDQKS